MCLLSGYGFDCRHDIGIPTAVTVGYGLVVSLVDHVNTLRQNYAGTLSCVSPHAR